MTIRPAKPEEFDAVQSFYDRLIDEMQVLPYRPKWQKGIYPDCDYLRSALEAGELCICDEGGAILSAMVVNHHTAEGYETAPWAVQAAPDEVSVVHTLGVSVAHMGQGIGTRMVRHAINRARSAGQKALRLDVLEGNVPARQLYLSLGFRFVGPMRLFYEDTGLCEFDLFEYALF